MTIRPTKSGVFPRLETGVHDVALGNMTQFRIGIIRASVHGQDGLFVGVETRGAYHFSNRADTGYVMDKLKLAPYDGDAAHIADFINDQNFEPGEIERQGTYLGSCCAK